MFYYLLFICVAFSLPSLQFPWQKHVCPVKPVQPIADLQLQNFLGTWFVQEQMEVIYQTKPGFYCTRDHYAFVDPKVPGKGIYLRTRWNARRVSGLKKEQTLHGLFAEYPKPSFLQVGFEWMPRFMRGPYFVIGSGRLDGILDAPAEYLLVSGGAPTHLAPNSSPAEPKCQTGRLFNYSGLWLMTRQSQRNETLIQLMRNQLTDLNYDLSVLERVEQAGCQYEDDE